MVKGLFIYNPKSGDRTIKNNLDLIFEKFQEYGIFLTPFRLFQNDGCTESLSDVFRSDKYSFLIVSGGDGSVNFMVNFLLKNGISLPMSIFPSGTCNDFARSIGMTGSVDDWINAVLAGNIKYVDAGLINNHHYFLGNVCGGMFADVSFNTGGDLKKNIGIVAYYLKALDNLPKTEAFYLSVETKDVCINENVILFLIINGKNVAGFTNFFKEADIEDGLIDILLFKNARPMELLNLFLKIISRELTGDNRIIHIRAKECKIQSDKKVQICVDGELGTLLPIHVQCIHPGMRLFVSENSKPGISS